MKDEICLNSKAHLFLTSSPFKYTLDNSKFKVLELCKENNLEKNLQKIWKKDSSILFIASDPNNHEKNEEIVNSIKNAFSKTSLSFRTIELCDGVNASQNLNNYNVIILGGGHVPTQNEFFENIKLREKIKDFEGILIGISAGTMNCADIVYAQPELDGESIDPNYKRFLKGLNLTKCQILPHYYSIKDSKLDGKRIIEDITYEDSIDHCFYILPDGSYIIQTLNECYLYGEGFTIKNKIIEKICNNNESKEIK